MLNHQAIGICSTIVDNYSNIKENLTGDKYYESCVLGPENNQIEIIA